MESWMFFALLIPVVSLGLWYYIWNVITGFLVLFGVLLLFLFFKGKPPKPAAIPCSTIIVLGSGGHTTEMMTMLRELDKDIYSPRVYVMAETDTLSGKKLEEIERDRTDYSVYTVHRIREVGQSYLTALFYSLPLSLVQSADVVKYNKPALMLCNGPGICVPISIIVRMCQALLQLPPVKIVYVESICRVKQLSLTGKMMKFLATEFLVQWPDLQKDRKTTFIGRIS